MLRHLVYLFFVCQGNSSNHHCPMCRTHRRKNSTWAGRSAYKDYGSIWYLSCYSDNKCRRPWLCQYTYIRWLLLRCFCQLLRPSLLAFNTPVERQRCSVHLCMGKRYSNACMGTSCNRNKYNIHIETTPPVMNGVIRRFLDGSDD
jgi:hypothetical protein